MHCAAFGQPSATARLRQERMFALLLGELPGGRLVAKRGDRVVGVLRMIRSPGCRMPGGEVARLSVLLSAILGEAAPRVAEWFAIWVGHDPCPTHWHLGPFAVAVDVQGRGIGSRLLAACCEHVDRLGEPLHLETDKPENVRLYQRFGFQTREEVEILGVTNYFMWRPPATMETRGS
jgi:GNAT superfamily N-acetyltransferase